MTSLPTLPCVGAVTEFITGCFTHPGNTLEYHQHISRLINDHGMNAYYSLSALNRLPLLKMDTIQTLVAYTAIDGSTIYKKNYCGSCSTHFNDVLHLVSKEHHWTMGAQPHRLNCFPGRCLAYQQWLSAHGLSIKHKVTVIRC